MNALYKPGEEILVAYSDHDKFTHSGFFVGFTKAGKVIVEDEYGDVSMWALHEKKKQKKLVPWCPEDIKPGMALRHKSWTKGEWIIPTGVNSKSVYVDRDFVLFSALLESWETLDGKPCGKEVEE